MGFSWFDEVRHWVKDGEEMLGLGNVLCEESVVSNGLEVGLGMVWAMVRVASLVRGREGIRLGCLCLGI